MWSKAVYRKQLRVAISTLDASSTATLLFKLDDEPVHEPNELATNETPAIAITSFVLFAGITLRQSVDAGQAEIFHRGLRSLGVTIQGSVQVG